MGNTLIWLVCLHLGFFIIILNTILNQLSPWVLCVYILLRYNHENYKNEVRGRINQYNL